MKSIIKKIAILVLLILPIAVTAQHQHGEHSNSNALDVRKVQEGSSIYHSSAIWTNHRREKVKLSDFKGHPVIIVMVYGNCTQVCPILIRDARRVFEGTDESLRTDVRVAVVTFDPENDTPERLMKYAAEYGLNLPQWHFLTGKSTQVRELAMLLGVEYTKKSDGHFAHSNLVTVLDEQGVIAERIIGLNQPVNDAVKFIENKLRQTITVSNKINQHNHK
jgi:protein SCO1